MDHDGGTSICQVRGATQPTADWLLMCHRGRMLNSFGVDDWFMFATEILFTLHLIFQLLDINLGHGNGVHIEFLRQADAERALKWWYVCGVFYILGTCLLKVAIGLFLLRFVTSAWQTKVIWGTIASAGFFGTIYLVFYLLLCRPISFFWTLSPDAPGVCFPPAVFLNTGYVVAGLNALADCVFAVLPAIIVWNTSMDRRTRILVICLLSFGSLAVLGTIIRIPFGHSFSNYKGDFLYQTTPIAVLSSLELGLGIVAANCAALRPLIQRIWPSSFGFLTRRASSVRTDDQEAGWAAMARVQKMTGRKSTRKGGPRRVPGSRGITSLTGRESIGGIPDLILARASMDRTGTQNSGRSLSQSGGSRLGSFVAKEPRFSKMSVTFSMRSSDVKEEMEEPKPPAD